MRENVWGGKMTGGKLSVILYIPCRLVDSNFTEVQIRAIQRRSQKTYQAVCLIPLSQTVFLMHFFCIYIRNTF